MERLSKILMELYHLADWFVDCEFRHRLCKDDNLPIDGGMLPLKLFEDGDKSSNINMDKFPIEEGI